MDEHEVNVVDLQLLEGKRYRCGLVSLDVVGVEHPQRVVVGWEKGDL
jgi:hypothetical protein